jgi:hypothetical protein
MARGERQVCHGHLMWQPRLLSLPDISWLWLFHFLVFLIFWFCSLVSFCHTFLPFFSQKPVVELKLSRLLFNPSDSIYPASVWFACPFSIHNKL